MVKKYVTTAQLLSLFTLIWTIWLGSIELSELFCTHVEKNGMLQCVKLIVAVFRFECSILCSIHVHIHIF